MRNIFIIVGVLLVVMTIAPLLIWVERRLLALWQDRLGPNRVGPFGLLQVVADMIKIFFKEDWIPPFADKAVFVMAPGIVMATVLLTFGVIPLRRIFIFLIQILVFSFFWGTHHLVFIVLFLAVGPPTVNIHCLALLEVLPRC